VRDPGRYGVVELDDDEHVIGIEEKPEKPRSHLAIPGMYFFDHRAVEFAGSLTPSARGEVEITDLLRIYMEHDELAVEVLGRGVAWLDAGTHDALIQASNFVQAVQQRQGLMISCPEEIAYRLGYIDVDSLRSLAEMMGNNEYRDYLFQLLDPSLVRREHRMQE
jgi:glucose-1-phosphate thymidylyltransferase